MFTFTINAKQTIDTLDPRVQSVLDKLPLTNKKSIEVAKYIERYIDFVLSKKDKSFSPEDIENMDFSNIKYDNVKDALLFVADVYDYIDWDLYFFDICNVEESVSCIMEDLIKTYTNVEDIYENKLVIDEKIGSITIAQSLKNYKPDEIVFIPKVRRKENVINGDKLDQFWEKSNEDCETCLELIKDEFLSLQEEKNRQNESEIL